MASIEALQEQALQMEVDIYIEVPPTTEGEDPIARARTIDELQESITAKIAENIQVAKAQKDEDEEYRQSAVEADKRIAAAAEASIPKAPPEVVVGAAIEPPAYMLKRFGLKKPSKMDRALAKRHAFPMAIPGGKAYRAKMQLSLAMPKQLFPAGRVVILIPQEALHLKQWLIAV